MKANLNRKVSIYSLEKIEPENAIIEEVRRIAQKYQIDEIIPLSTGDISVAKWVHLKCKYGCNKYGTNWCCPPETPTPDQAKALLSEYKKALLLCGSIENNQFYRDNQKKRRIQVNIWKGTVALERHLFLGGYYKAFGLVSESCALW
jgi:predicted metal-binding protein